LWEFDDLLLVIVFDLAITLLELFNADSSYCSFIVPVDFGLKKLKRIFQNLTNLTKKIYLNNVFFKNILNQILLEKTFLNYCK